MAARWFDRLFFDAAGASALRAQAPPCRYRNGLEGEY